MFGPTKGWNDEIFKENFANHRGIRNEVIVFLINSGNVRESWDES